MTRRFMPGSQGICLESRRLLDGSEGMFIDPPPDISDATVAVEDAMARADKFPNNQQTAFEENDVPYDIQMSSDYPGAEAGVLGSSFTGSTQPYVPPSGPTQIPPIDALD